MIVLVLLIKNVCPAHRQIVKWIPHLMIVLVLAIKLICPGTGRIVKWILRASRISSRVVLIVEYLNLYIFGGPLQKIDTPM